MRIPRVNLIPVHTMYSRTIYTVLSHILPGTWSQPLSPVTPGTYPAYLEHIRTTTDLHELNMALDASRDGPTCKLRASTDAVGVEIGGALAACEGQSLMHTHQQTRENIVFKQPRALGGRSRKYLTGTFRKATH